MDLEERSAHIETLLAEIERACGPNHWPRVEELVTALLDLHREGIARLLACMPEGDFEERVAKDPFASALLCLHALHPVPFEARVRSAVERANGSQAARVEIETIDGTSLTMRVTGASDEMREIAARVATRAIQDVAPEVADIEMRGVPKKKTNGLLAADKLVRK